MKKVFFFLILILGCFLYAQEILVNNDDEAPGFIVTGTWHTSSESGYQQGTYLFTRESSENSTATWTALISESGFYEVSAIFLASPNRTAQAPYSITHADGTDIVTISQYDNASRGQLKEVVLGKYYFETGTNGKITLSNSGGQGVYIADAIRFTRSEGIHLSFSKLSFSPQFPQKNDTVSISAGISPSRYINKVQAHYIVQGEEYIQTLPTSFENGLYKAQIPAYPSQKVVKFYFTAVDSEKNQYTSDSLSYQVDRGEYRVIWAHSWGPSFRSPAEAEELIQTCRNNNINTIMIQVRKVGDAYYQSTIEPRATNITGGEDYDPLQYLIDLAHDTSNGKEYIHVHAWFVMQRIDTTGEMKQKNPAHILYLHPEFKMHDDKGEVTHSNSFYLDPGHPGSVDWNINVILDCMEKYDIDGVNLDYIRYPGARWGYNPTSLARFQAAFDRNDIPAFNDPDWSDWRRLQITNQIKKLYVKMLQKDPKVVLTACTINWGEDFTDALYAGTSAYNGVFQDWVGWLREGIIDYNALMNYSPKDQPARYKGWTDFSLANDDIRGSIIGIGAYLQETVDDSMKQLKYARAQGAAGVNIYAWFHEVDKTTRGESRADFYTALRTQLFNEWIDPPLSTWKTSPQKGIIEGTITYNGKILDHCAVKIKDNPASRVYSDGTGWYALLEMPPGKHSLLFEKDGYPVRKIDVQVKAGGDIVNTNIDLK